MSLLQALEAPTDTPIETFIRLSPRRLPLITCLVLQHRNRVVQRLWDMLVGPAPAKDDLWFLDRVAEMHGFDALYSPAIRRNFSDPGPGSFPSTLESYRGLLCHLFNT